MKKQLCSIFNNYTDLCYYSDIRIKSSCKGDYSRIARVKGDKGIYIFFKECKKEIIYVGESHKNGCNWSIFSRLTQHFQPSQKTCVLYKCMHKYCDQDEQKALDWFRVNKVKVGYISMNNRDKDYILKVEQFLIDIFKPEFNLEKLGTIG